MAGASIRAIARIAEIHVENEMRRRNRITVDTDYFAIAILSGLACRRQTSFASLGSRTGIIAGARRRIAIPAYLE
jgi:hypothetical protein